MRIKISRIEAPICKPSLSFSGTIVVPSICLFLSLAVFYFRRYKHREHYITFLIGSFKLDIMFRTPCWCSECAWKFSNYIP